MGCGNSTKAACVRSLNSTLESKNDDTLFQPINQNFTEIYHMQTINLGIPVPSQEKYLFTVKEENSCNEESCRTPFVKLPLNSATLNNVF